MTDKPYIILRHGLVPTKKTMMLLPLGFRFNKNILDAEMGDRCITDQTNEVVEIVTKALIPLRSAVTGQFSEIANTLAIAIYGKTIDVVFGIMSANWKDYVEDKYLILLVVDKIDGEENS